MPIFEYVCDDCEKQFEAILLREDQEVRCPECSSRSVEKQLSTFAVSSGSANTAAPSSAACGPGRFT